MPSTKRIFGIGTVVVDHVVVLPQFPDRDTKLAIDKEWHQIGGPVPVALSTAAFYEIDTCFAGRWGLDEFGRQIEVGLRERGIDITPSESDSSWRTGFAHVWTEPGEGSRTIAFSRGTFPDPDCSTLDPHRIQLRTCGILHLDGAAGEFALAAARQVRADGGGIVLDAGSRKPGMEDLMPLLDVLIASELFCRSWFGSSDVATERILELGPRSVIRTRGAGGCVYQSASEEIRVPGIEVEAVDTNGAGDIFSGAFLVGLANNWGLLRCLRFANYVAGYSCAHAGNSSWPSFEQFLDYESRY